MSELISTLFWWALALAAYEVLREVVRWQWKRWRAK